MKFTVGIEKHDCILFMDVLVRKVHSSFEVDTFLEATDTGLGLRFDSAMSFIYKLNLTDCLLAN